MDITKFIKFESNAQVSRKINKIIASIFGLVTTIGYMFFFKDSKFGYTNDV